MSRYIGPIKWLGGIAVGLFAFAYLFSLVIMPALPEDIRNGVLTHAIPFFAAFVGVLLLFILLIVLVARRFDRKIPNRTYKSIENLIVFTIIFSVVCLFNPWSFVPYRYGFGMLVIATLSFIVWSHVAPPRTGLDETIKPFTSVNHLVGVIAAAIVMVLIISSAIATNEPRAPFGIRERVWNTYDEARQAEIATAATSDFSQVEIPFLVIFSLIPGAMVYLLSRELVGGRGSAQAG